MRGNKRNSTALPTYMPRICPRALGTGGKAKGKTQTPHIRQHPGRRGLLCPTSQLHQCEPQILSHESLTPTLPFPSPLLPAATFPTASLPPFHPSHPLPPTDPTLPVTPPHAQAHRAHPANSLGKNDTRTTTQDALKRDRSHPPRHPHCW